MRKTKKPPRRLPGGFFSIERRVLTEDMRGDPPLMLAWIILIGWANIADSKTKLNGQQVILKRGQLVTGTQELAEEIGCNRIVIRRILSYLEETQRISQQISQRGRIITIHNYDKYQTKRHKDSQSKSQSSANRQPTDSQSSATSEQENKRTREQENFSAQSPPAPKKFKKALFIEAKEIGHSVYSGIVDEMGKPRFVDLVALDVCFKEALETYGIQVLRRLKALADGADEYKVRNRAFDAYHVKRVCAAIAQQMMEHKESC